MQVSIAPRRGSRLAGIALLVVAICMLVPWLAGYWDDGMPIGVGEDPSGFRPQSGLSRESVESVRIDAGVVDSGSGCEIVVSGVTGAPIAGVDCYSWPLASVPPRTEDVAVATTDGKGTVRLPEAVCDATAKVRLWATSYAPLLVDGVVRGASIRVTMQLEQRAHFRVRTPDGAPVRGYAVGLVRADSDTPPLPAGNSWSLVVRPSGGGGNASFAVSNEAGMIEIGGIERGRYYIRHNLLDAPFTGRRVPVVVDVPSAEVDIEVEALCGVLFSVAGDEVLLTKNLEIGRGAQMHSERSAKEACLRALWANRLRAKWPGATCYVGVPASTTQAAGRVSLEVFGRFSGWNEFEVPLQRVSDVVEPTALAARLVGERAGSMVVTLVQADGGEVDLPGGLASISYESPSGLASFGFPFGEPAVVPSGEFRLLASGELPDDLFPAQIGKIEPGVRSEIRVVVPPVTRWRVVPKLPGGVSPSRWGLQFVGRVKEHRGLFGRDCTLYTKDDTVPFIVYVQGYVPKTGILVRLSGLRANGGLEHVVIEMAELQRL